MCRLAYLTFGIYEDVKNNENGCPSHATLWCVMGKQYKKDIQRYANEGQDTQRYADEGQDTQRYANEGYDE